MIKLLKKYQIQVTPFAPTKGWNLNNNDNENLLLFESTGSDDGLPLALEFIDYNDGSSYPTVNSLCDVALEQQTNDFATSRTGLNVEGIVSIGTEPLNDDGTYKRSIYHQIKTTFYNNYIDPSKMWGMENIDFTLSKTQRNLSDQFRLIDIPRNVYGDKIVPKTVRIYDNTLDNINTITDDGNGNLFAHKNLFSHQQEVGEYMNKFISNLSSSYCDDYWNNIQSNLITYPVFYNTTTSKYYTISIRGNFGNEYVQIDSSNLNITTPITFYNTETNMYYTMNVIGNLGHEILTIDSTSSINITPIQIYNNDTDHYYNLKIIGTIGNEILEINII